MLLPKPLKPGAKIGLIAPSSPIYEKNNYILAPKHLKSLGFEVVEGDSCFHQHGYLAGKDKLRLDDIHKMFEDKTIDGIIALRGGSGASRLLNMIDFELIRANPKVFCGFSDITALHCAFQAKCNLVTFHGPMAGHPGNTGFRNSKNLKMFLEVTSSLEPLGKISNPDGSPFKILNKGKAVKGKLIGGNLTVLSQLMGTPFLPPLSGKILLLEAIGQRPYEIDAQLMHLKNAGVFEKCVAILLGPFTKCSSNNRPSLSLEEIFQEILPDNLPILKNVHAGHDDDKLTLPLNIPYSLEDDRLNILAPAVANI